MSVNERLIYIEDNLDTLTTEDYVYSTTISLTAEEWATVSKVITFDKIFLENPTVTVALETNPDNKFSTPSVSNITTTSCKVSIKYNATTSRTCKIGVVASGKIAKSIGE